MINSLMKLLMAMTVGVIFFSTDTFARKLTYKEQELASSVEELIRLNNEYLTKITAQVNLDELPISKYLSLLVLKNGCTPFKQSLEEISMADESYPDQSLGLSEKLGICKRSADGLKVFDVFANNGLNEIDELSLE